jgi:hypothetical protein
MPLKVTLICLFTFVLFVRGAYSEEGVYVKEQQKVFLIVEDFTQWASFTYDFFDNQTSSYGYSNHNFYEKYHLLTNFDILDRDILYLQLAGDIGLAQLETSGTTAINQSASSSKLNYNYTLGGTAFERSWHPISFNSSLSTVTTSNPFTEQFTSTVADNGIQFSFLKGPVKTKLGYQNTRRDITGAGSTTDSTTEKYTASGLNDNKTIGLTTLDTTFERVSGNVTTLDGFQILLNNSLLLRQNSLVSTGQWQSTDTQGILSRNIFWQEGLYMPLGKALKAELQYKYSNDKTTSFSGGDQTTSSHSLSATLTHRLFQSLTTNLNGFATFSDILGGKQDTFTGVVTEQYFKNLSADSHLSLGLLDSYSWTQRDLPISDITVRDEPHTVDQQGVVFTLGLNGTLARVVSVTSKNPDILYVEGIDYTVDPILRTVTVVQGGTIAPGTRIFISYILRVDPSITFYINTLTLTGNLSWLRGRYVLAGFFSLSTPSLISGTNGGSFSSSRQEQVRFDASYPTAGFGVEWGEYVSGPSDSRYVTGYGNYSRVFPHAYFSSNLALRLSDRYTMYGATVTLGAYEQNAFSTTVSYAASFPWGQCSLSGTYSNNSGEHVSIHDLVYVQALVSARYNKLALNLRGLTTYRFLNGYYTRNDAVHLELIRWF